MIYCRNGAASYGPSFDEVWNTFRRLADVVLVCFEIVQFSMTFVSHAQTDGSVQDSKVFSSDVCTAPWSRWLW